MPAQSCPRSGSRSRFRYVGDVLDAEVDETAKRRTAERAGKGSYKLKKRVVCVNDGMGSTAPKAVDHYRVHRTSIGQVARAVKLIASRALRFKVYDGRLKLAGVSMAVPVSTRTILSASRAVTGVGFGFDYRLSWQFQYAGPNLQNLRLLVCPCF